MPKIRRVPIEISFEGALKRPVQLDLLVQCQGNEAIVVPNGVKSPSISFNEQEAARKYLPLK